MGCNCSKGTRANDNDNNNNNVKERRRKPNSKTTPKKKKKSASSSKANVGSEERSGFIDGVHNEATLSLLIPSDAKNNAPISSDDAEKKANLERKSSRSLFQRRPTIDTNKLGTLQQPNMTRISSVSNGERGAQVMAGWPSWLAAVAGEAINGWITRKADSFEKLEKIGQGTYSSVYKARDLETNQIVALKKVRFANMDPESVRFMARVLELWIKAFGETPTLSTLCEIQVCVIYYGRDGELIKTWPEDQSKVRDMAERFSKLSHKEKNKKSTNLSQFLNKKINDEKKRSLDDNKFSQKVLEMEDSLENHLQILQDRHRRLLYPQDQSEPDQSRLEQNHNFMGSSSGFTTGFTADDQSRVASTGFTTDPLMNLSNDQIRVASTGFTTYSSPSLINDHLKSTEQDLSRAVYNSGGFATDSLNHHQSKFSIFLYNHDNATFTPLADSVSSVDQALTPINNLGLRFLC